MQNISLDPESVERLVALAEAARQRAYAPFSRYRVGAALLAVDGQVFSGCNVENASYGATICAERVAACTAIAEGNRQWRCITIATAGGAAPCGICRQFLAEFAPDLTIILFDCESRTSRAYSLGQLLPEPF